MITIRVPKNPNRAPSVSSANSHYSRTNVASSRKKAREQMNKIKSSLDDAKEIVEELQSAFNDLVWNDRHDMRITNFNRFQKVLNDFLTERINGVHDAMDDAVDEIDRLEDVVDGQRDMINDLNETVSELKFMEEN